MDPRELDEVAAITGRRERQPVLLLVVLTLAAAGCRQCVRHMRGSQRARIAAGAGLAQRITASSAAASD